MYCTASTSAAKESPSPCIVSMYVECNVFLMCWKSKHKYCPLSQTCECPVLCAWYFQIILSIVSLPNTVVSIYHQLVSTCGSSHLHDLHLLCWPCCECAFNPWSSGIWWVGTNMGGLTSKQFTLLQSKLCFISGHSLEYSMTPSKEEWIFCSQWAWIFETFYI